MVLTIQYLFGDALTDSTDCVGPFGEPYPTFAIDQLLPKLDLKSNQRGGRTLFAQPLITSESVKETRKNLLSTYAKANRKLDSGVDSFETVIHRVKRQAEQADSNSTQTDTDTDTDTVTESESSAQTCKSAAPSRLCQTMYNTSAPMFGVSLTSGNPVTIVQKFPELLQQVVYETCTANECDLLHGECVQTFIPYLFLVIPLGPVTLTGQDYVLVESGCSCRPKYAGNRDPDPLSGIPDFS
ncbi:hypothetical protein TCAL_02702 [Tigriopus californicus]|uniref:Uncharacterized protein n=1 Tax=Tigriopus californicus TaxID=6832 RepID=A0A553PHD0_TIGCA|nr:hypothetical protein TCAL_02702 [Tigriopus californicus]|eukprot:TCALIF_02702-PA protein Name:"Protein of unknown function" AED:0.03 eAED:0.03 QI:680/0.75/0.8/1/1/1/5/132/240